VAQSLPEGVIPNPALFSRVRDLARSLAGRTPGPTRDPFPPPEKRLVSLVVKAMKLVLTFTRLAASATLRFPF